MAGKDSLLGDMSTRRKTTMVLPSVLVKHAESVCYSLGIPKNAWISMGISLLTMRMLPLLSPGKKRDRIFKDLEQLVNKLLVEIKSSL